MKMADVHYSRLKSLHTDLAMLFLIWLSTKQDAQIALLHRLKNLKWDDVSTHVTRHSLILSPRVFSCLSQHSLFLIPLHARALAFQVIDINLPSSKHAHRYLSLS